MAPRLRQVRRAEASDLVRPYYDLAFGDRDPVDDPGTEWGTVGTWWTVLALVPEILDQTARAFGELYRNPGFRLDRRLRELALVRVGWTRQSNFVLVPHRRLGFEAGVGEVQMRAIATWTTSDCFSPAERAVLTYTDELILGGGRVSDATFAALRTDGGLSDEEILELTYTVALYELQAVMSLALRLESDDRDDPAVEEVTD